MCLLTQLIRYKPYSKKVKVPNALGLVLTRPDLRCKIGEQLLELVDKFLANMDVGVGAFTSCDIRLGHQLTFEPCSTASLHYCLAGRGILRVKNGVTIMLRQHSFVLLPPCLTYSLGASESKESWTAPHRRLRAPLFKESIPIIQAGEGEIGILTACGEVGVPHTSIPDLFAHLTEPIVEHFDGPDGLRNQFVLLLAESARPGIGMRVLTEALLKQCLVLLLRRQIERGTPSVSWMKALAEPGLARALEAIFERPSERFSVESLAAIAGMSRSAFAAHFTHTIGQTPMSLLKLARLRGARELLATTNSTVDHIACSMGFSSRSNFSHSFRAIYGVDPTRFRAVSLMR
jgi:AraC family transcriptional activator of mtrCDE